MGFRLRKSIRMGGFRINLSKSGIGYSFGVPGLRYTKMANGRDRTTYSIPGTGLSYVDESCQKEQNNFNNEQRTTAYNESPEQVYGSNLTNEVFDNSTSGEFLSAINSFKKRDLIYKLFIIIGSILIFCVSKSGATIFIGIMTFVFYIIYRNKKLLVNVEYDFDETCKTHYEKLTLFLNELNSCSKLWMIKSGYQNIDAKRNAGASANINRAPISIIQKVPYYLKTNIVCYCLSLEVASFYFLPDKVLIETSSKTSCLNFEDFVFNFGNVLFVESEIVPNDAEINDYTWQYVNKNGSPDKRYKVNPKYPVCNYGKMEIKSSSGLNVSIILSSNAKTKQIEQCYKNIQNYNVDVFTRCKNCNEKISTDAKFCKFCGETQN